MHDPKHDIGRLAELIRGVNVAMLTTIRADGHVVTRPLGTQDVDFDGDLWFATEADSPKLAEIEANPSVNVGYAAPDAGIYVSVCGQASACRDRARIEQIWSPRMQAFFPAGKDDPNLVLIHVQAESAQYWDGPHAGTGIGKVLYFATPPAVNGAAGQADPLHDPHHG